MPTKRTKLALHHTHAATFPGLNSIVGTSFFGEDVPGGLA